MNKLLNLLQANKDRGQKLVVKAEAGTAHVYLYDAIGGWFGVEAKDFIAALNDIKEPEIVLHINSPGGDVFDARAISTAIKQHASKITAQIDGLCASAATYISAACSNVTMADGGFYMIHEGWTMAIGNKGDMRSTADLLDKVDGSILNDYEKKTGQSRDQLTQWMEAETWFDAAEAKQNGFIDEIITAENGTSNASRWNLNAYANAPKAEPEKNTEAEEEAAHKEFMARLRRQTEAIAMANG